MEKTTDNNHEHDRAGSEFAAKLIELIQREKILLGCDRQTKVIEFKHPHELKELLPLEIREDGADNTELLSVCEQIIRYSVKSSHPMFFNQFYYGADPYGVAATWLTEALNANEHTYEVAPVFILITQFVIQRLNALIGFTNGDGIFCPGASAANHMAVTLARYAQNNDVVEDGLFGSKRLVMFASEDSHYSHSKGCAYLGFGTKSLVSVKTDTRGRMCVKDLQLKIQTQTEKGHVPFLVAATAGTTVLGAYDNIEEINHVCKEHKLWLHVDAAWGGGVIFSAKHRYRLKGIENVDSLCIAFNKMMGAPLQCIMFLTKQNGLLQKCFGLNASYLFQQDKFYDVSYDIGDKTIQCGRKVDGLKLWLMWKERGDKGMAEHVNTAFEKAQYFIQKLKETEGFEMVMDTFECLNVCFWYIPKRMREQQRTPEWWQQLDKVASQIKTRMQLEGTTLIGYTRLPSKNFVNFFRIIVLNARSTLEDLDRVIDIIDDYGCNL